MTDPPHADQEKIRQLFTDYLTSVRGFALRSGLAPEDADEVVVDTFVIAWQRPTSLPEGEAVLYWLLAVARNLIHHRWRHQARSRRLASRLEHELEMTEQAADVLTSGVLEAVSRLPKRYKDAIILVEWHGFTHDEAAAVMHCSANASRVRLHRAKARVRRELLGPTSATTPSSTEPECSEQ